MSFQINSTDIIDGQPIAKRFTKYGHNITPNISWSTPPEGTHELLLICYDPDAQRVAGKVFVHWLVTLDPNKSTPKGSNALKNDFSSNRYDGPKPPSRSGVHHYHFKIIALDRHIDFDPDSTYIYADVMNKISRHIIAESEIVGTYEKKK